MGFVYRVFSLLKLYSNSTIYLQDTLTSKTFQECLILYELNRRGLSLSCNELVAHKLSFQLAPILCSVALDVNCFVMDGPCELQTIIFSCKNLI